VTEVMDAEIIDAKTGEVVTLPAVRQMRGEVLARDQVQVTTADALELANELRAVVNDRGWFSKIQGRDYLNVEAWTFIGGRLGMTAKTKAEPFMHPQSGEWIGYNGHAALFDRRTGEEVACADHVCLFDEPGRKWAVNHAVGMSQTRAVSRAYQEQFRWIAQLAGYEGTPEEEMHGVDAPSRREAPPPRREPQRRTQAPPPPRDESADPKAQAFLFMPGDPQPPDPKFKLWGRDAPTRNPASEYANTTWDEMAKGSFGGKRYQWCRYVLSQPDAPASTRERARITVWLIENREHNKRADMEAAKGEETPF
jgi:hypothetical protein